MGYRTLRQCVEDLESAGRLVRLEQEIDADLEAAEVQRRVFRSGGPAVLFTNVRGRRFPMVSNLFGSVERVRFMFRDTLDAVRRLIELRIDPAAFWRRPGRYGKAALAAWRAIPRRCRTGPVLARDTTIDQLPQLKSWPDDGGAFITLPQVYTESVDRPGMRGANLGMYRVQISGGQYRPNREVGLHYQIHRGIGVHHAAAIRRGEPLRVNVFVGGAPAMTLAAVMPLPEGMSELTLAGALAGHRIPMICRPGQLAVYAEADFCIRGVVGDKTLPEGPFGDHLGYYSLKHEFPVLQVEQVCHRQGAIWPFTAVGRPPQEDTILGQLVHELAAPLIPKILPGVHAVHAVDAAGVHPLMLAIGSERYCRFEPLQQPQELLTQANAILGQGQMSLTKYLLIVERHDDPDLDIRDVAAFFQHLLARADWRRDLHFQTRTTIDTLDYCGPALNEGSKLVIAAVGAPKRRLPAESAAGLRLPPGFRSPRVCMPGVLALEGPPFSAHRDGADSAAEGFCAQYRAQDAINQFPLILIVDDSDFAARTLDNWLWVVFTRSDPASDVYGVEAFTERKHWGCRGSLVIDARIKPHHAPPLAEDPQVSRRVDALAARGGPLAKHL